MSYARFLEEKNIWGFQEAMCIRGWQECTPTYMGNDCKSPEAKCKKVTATVERALSLYSSTSSSKNNVVEEAMPVGT